MADFADMLPVSARAVVYTQGKVYLIELNKMYQPEEAGGTNISWWMSGLLPLITTSDIGEYPFRVVYDELKKLHEEERRKLDLERQSPR